MAERPEKLLHRLRDAVRLMHYANSTEKTYVYWASALSSITTSAIRVR